MHSGIDRKADTLRRALFLCHDNHHTSRFCEELFNSFARTEGLHWQAASRGILGTPARHHDDAMSAEAIASLRRLGVAPVNHLRLPLELTDFDLQMSDLVIAVYPADLGDALAARWPEWDGRIEHWSIGTGPAPSAGLGELARKVRLLVAGLEGQVPGTVGARDLRVAPPGLVRHGV